MRVHQSFLDDCGLRQQFKQTTKQYFGGSVRALGSAYHKALEIYYLDRQHLGGLPDPCVDDLVIAACDEFVMIETGDTTSHVSEVGKELGGFIWGKAVPTREDAFEKLDIMIRMYFEPESQAVWPEQWKVLGVEQSFELPWKGDDTRGGSIDLILEDEDSHHIVVEDHKTAGRKWNAGKESPRKNLQAPWYSWAVQELYPDRYGYLSTFGIMTYAGKFERRISNPEPRHIAAAEKVLSDAVALFKTSQANGIDMPANPSSTLCAPQYCDFWDQCPHGAALE